MSFTPEEAEKAVKERMELLSDVGIVDEAKQQIASAAMVMECCVIMARDIVHRQYELGKLRHVDDIKQKRDAMTFKLFEALMRPAPAPQPQQIIPIDPRRLREVPKI